MSTNAEYNVIGGLLLDPQALYRIPNPLQPRDFQKPENRRAYTTICKLLKAGKAVDVFLVEEAGGGTVAYLGELARNTPGSANIAAHAALIKQSSRLRQTEIALKNGLEKIRAGRPLDEIRQSVMVALENHQDHQAKLFGELVDEALTHAEEARRLRATSSVIGISTTLPMLNHLTGGLHGPKLIVLGGRPGTFKTAYALQVAIRAAADDKPVGFVSIEMGGRELIERAIANTLRIDGCSFVQGEPDALQAAQEAREWEWPLFVEDKLYTWPEIAARIIGWKHQHDIQLAVIDYLQIIHTPGKASRFEKLGEISREAKLLAMRLGIPIMLLAQISRDVEKDKRRPLLSDIRECGNVEQDADIVLFTHRRQQEDRPDDYELILAKQRNGQARQVIKLQIDGPSYLVGELWEQGV